MRAPIDAEDDGGGGRVFVADDKFADVIRCLEARGWRRHPHATFPGASLKWLNYRRVAWTASSARRQTLNHLQHAVHFSQKELFARALYAYEQQQQQQVVAVGVGDGGSSSKSSATSVHTFFLRTFDLARDGDAALLAEWELYARAVAALKYVSGGAAGDSEQVDAACALAEVVVAAGAAFFSRVADAPAVLDVDAPAWHPLRRCSRDGEDEDVDEEGAPLSGSHLERAAHALRQLEALDPQFGAVGCANRSVWICKPAHLSQGRGIRLLTSLTAILALRREGRQWVVQKYMEQPLVSVHRGRKFDVRQWVLITSLTPLRVFWYAQSYLRFCSQRFSLARDRLDDRFMHLSNYSVQKDAAAATSSSSPADEADEEDELMWSSERFREHLWRAHGRDVWTESIVPQMQLATRAAILSTAPMLRAVGRGFEWLGLDFLLDASLRPWLLEVNVSPDVSHSTSVTAALVPRATEDLLELILDGTRSPTNGWLPFAC